jgi:hypothetical protein
VERCKELFKVQGSKFKVRGKEFLVSRSTFLVSVDGRCKELFKVQRLKLDMELCSYEGFRLLSPRRGERERGLRQSIFIPSLHQSNWGENVAELREIGEEHSSVG